MSYDINITLTAEQDLEKVTDYIESILKNPQAADDFLDEVTKKISTLAHMPEKFALVDDPVLRSWGIRFLMISNYHVFYLLSKKEKRVIIVRILYAKRNWLSILKKGFSFV